MADFVSKDTRHAGSQVDRVFHAGQEADFVFGRGSLVFSRVPIEIYGRTTALVVLDANKRHFEFGFRIDTALAGNAATGWTDAGNYLLLELQWSLDLVNWSMGKFIPAPVPVVDLGGGLYEYWGRCVHAQDAAVKTAEITCVSGTPYAMGGFPSDARNNPLTALTVAGVSLALGGFPYTMGTAGEDARMQTDLRAFYPSATVTATSNLLWSITIPGVSQTLFTKSNKVSWPQYMVADQFGALTVAINGASLGGVWVDSDGVAIYTKAFGRMQISAGSRYDPYL